ncbi:hypothetical protein Vqi01_59720 [Micromonospora qiuiae]|uniref:EamA domain-containing protein n=2 Tax=Micromonospora qiuiae TaxID=502268 RepID=A0ABQ4JMX7_9ACTN|nr:hypothetical protein Vqi01_59720 [Micromonospora qiuiae]
MLSASQLGAAAILLAAAMPIAGLDTREWWWDAVASVLVLGALGTDAADVLNYRIIQDEGPTAASVVTYLLPLVTVALGWTVLGEAINMAILVGVVLVLGGVVLSKRTLPGK